MTLAQGISWEHTVAAQHLDSVAGANAIDHDAQRTHVSVVSSALDTTETWVTSTSEMHTTTEFANYLVTFDVQHGGPELRNPTAAW